MPLLCQSVFCFAVQSFLSLLGCCPRCVQYRSPCDTLKSYRARCRPAWTPPWQRYLRYPRPHFNLG